MKREQAARISQLLYDINYLEKVLDQIRKDFSLVSNHEDYQGIEFYLSFKCNHSFGMGERYPVSPTVLLKLIVDTQVEVERELDDLKLQLAAY